MRGGRQIVVPPLRALRFLVQYLYMAETGD